MLPQPYTICQSGGPSLALLRATEARPRGLYQKVSTTLSNLIYSCKSISVKDDNALWMKKPSVLKFGSNSGT